MKSSVFIFIALLLIVRAAESQEIYLFSKRETMDTTSALVVLFHDKAVTTVAECQKEIQRGIRDQWRYYHHTFPRAVGYSENRDYLCLSGSLKVTPWDQRAPYTFIYLVDVRSPKAQFIKMKSLAACLRGLRGGAKGESRKLFCGKLSQVVVP